MMGNCREVVVLLIRMGLGKGKNLVLSSRGVCVASRQPHLRTESGGKGGQGGQGTLFHILGP